MLEERTASRVRADSTIPLPADLSRADLRQLISETGLKEYWYPALEDRNVGKKPVGLKICGEQVVFFRGQDRQVKALSNICPHRGGSLMHGDCHFEGTISCPYHGWTFDGDGNVLAVLPEGPDSQVPGKIVHRSYPTRTLRGVVFIWMGQGEPAPIEEDVPEEFFDGSYHVLIARRVWPINWVKGLENSMDAHVFYVHRDAVSQLMNPLPGARGDSPAVLGRPVIYPNGVDMRRPPITGGPGEPYQVGFPRLGKWPKHRWRLLWAWIFVLARRRRTSAPAIVTNPNWTTGHRMPGMYRTFNRVFMYTRMMVPIDAENSRVWYYHTTKPASWVGRWYETLVFNLFHAWRMYDNFSVQDMGVMAPQRYDAPEYLSATDAAIVQLRRFLVLRARAAVNGSNGTGTRDERPVNDKHQQNGGSG